MKPLVFLLLTLSLFAQKSIAPIPTFADEFDGSELDLTKWSPHNPLRSVYAAGVATVSSGQVHLSPGAAISTFGLFSQTYGKFEIRCKSGPGALVKPSFHLLPLPLAPLPWIEVFTFVGGQPRAIILGNHWGTELTERDYGDSFNEPDLSSGFHVIGVEWDADKIVWSIDGQDRFRSDDGIPRQKMFLLIEAEGTTLDVDYVRVYGSTNSPARQ
jgi:hypothetical protein